MFKALVFALFVVTANCQLLNYGSRSYYSGGFGGYGLGNAGLGLSSYALGGVPSSYGLSYGNGLGFGSGLASGYGVGLGSARYVSAVAQPAISSVAVAQPVAVARPVHSAQVQQVTAAVISNPRTVEYKAVPYSGEPAVPQVIDVPPSEQPVQLNFYSKSSPLLVSQQHIAGEPGEVQVTQSEDEPHRLVHQVTKPVIQEVQEIIQPYRQITQEINPVIEQANTIVSQGQGVHLSGLHGGIVGQGGVIGSSAGLNAGHHRVGVAVAQPAVSAIQVAQPVHSVAVAQPVSGAYYGARSFGSGLGLGYGSGLGYSSGLGYGTGLIGGVRSSNLGNYGVSYGSGLGSGLLYGSGQRIYRSGY